jgi:serine/threonine-protein kinase RsbW
MNDSAWLWNKEVTFQGDPAPARIVVDALLEHLGRLGWDEEDVFGVHMAAEEALINALKHGNRYDASKSVWMSCRLGEQRVSITIRDEGSGFLPDEVPDPTKEEYIDRPCGRGVFLIRNYMSAVQYNERGNEVTMEKFRSP